MKVAGDVSLVERAPNVAAGAGQVGQQYLRHAAYLEDRDRLMLELCYRRGLSRSEIGRLYGLTPGAVSRRIGRLTARLKDPLVLGLIEAPDGELAARHRAIGIGHFLHGRSACDLAREHAMRPREVRDVIAYLRGWRDRGRMKAEG